MMKSQGKTWKELMELSKTHPFDYSLYNKRTAKQLKEKTFKIIDEIPPNTSPEIAEYFAMSNETVTRYHMNRTLRQTQARRFWLFISRILFLTAGFLIAAVTFLFFLGPLDW